MAYGRDGGGMPSGCAVRDRPCIRWKSMARLESHTTVGTRGRRRDDGLVAGSYPPSRHACLLDDGERPACGYATREARMTHPGQAGRPGQCASDEVQSFRQFDRLADETLCERCSLWRQEVA